MRSLCRPLSWTGTIRTPKNLWMAVNVVRQNVDDGTIVQILRQGRSSTPIGNLGRDGSMPDFIEMDFQCIRCEEQFHLVCENYHGSGGRWSWGVNRQSTDSCPDHPQSIGCTATDDDGRAISGLTCVCRGWVHSLRPSILIASTMRVKLARARPPCAGPGDSHAPAPVPQTTWRAAGRNDPVAIGLAIG